jgi:hypothetical protein
MPTENTRVSKLRCEIEVYVASCNSRLQPSFLCPDPAESSVPAANPVEEIKTRTAMETIHEFACFCMRPRIVPAGGRFVNLSGPPGEIFSAPQDCSLDLRIVTETVSNQIVVLLIGCTAFSRSEHHITKVSLRSSAFDTAWVHRARKVLWKSLAASKFRRQPARSRRFLDDESGSNVWWDALRIGAFH